MAPLAPKTSFVVQASDNFNHLRNWSNVFHVFFTNIGVGLMLSVLGYITGGIGTILVMIWNGMIFNMTLHLLQEQYKNDSINYIYSLYFPHAITEIIALALFASIGLHGIVFYKSILYNKVHHFKIRPFICVAIAATFLLFISALIEIYA